MSKPFGIIYKVTNLVNGKCYIGKTTKTLDQRIERHLLDAKSKRYNSYIHGAIRKYGIENFEWEVLCECKDKSILNIMEKSNIIMNNSHFSSGHGYNLTWGGDGGNITEGKKHTIETKRKISNSRKAKDSQKNKQSKNYWVL